MPDNQDSIIADKFDHRKSTLKEEIFVFVFKYVL